MSEPIPTGCDAIDELLGGGFERGTVTQLYGAPAAGKTNLVLSAAAEVAADGAIAVIVDTEGLSVDRFEQVVGARAAETDEPTAALAERIAITEAMDFEEQREAVRDLGEFADSADLLVVDSATGFYRLHRDQDVEGGESLRAVADQITHLLSFARREDLAVVITNQVYTDPEEDKIRPLGGHTLDHWTGTILRLDRFRGGNRRATLEKHRSKAAGETAQFQITEDGIEGAERSGLSG